MIGEGRDFWKNLMLGDEKLYGSRNVLVVPKGR